MSAGPNIIRMPSDHLAPGAHQIPHNAHEATTLPWAFGPDPGRGTHTMEVFEGPGQRPISAAPWQTSPPSPIGNGDPNHSIQPGSPMPSVFSQLPPPQAPQPQPGYTQPPQPGYAPPPPNYGQPAPTYGYPQVVHQPAPQAPPPPPQPAFIEVIWQHPDGSTTSCAYHELLPGTGCIALATYRGRGLAFFTPPAGKLILSVPQSRSQVRVINGPFVCASADGREVLFLPVDLSES